MLLPDNPSGNKFDPDASLVLVGIRGCGKRSLGFIAATVLNRRFITEDYYFKEVTGYTRQEYLQKEGSEHFQRRDVEVLKMMLDHHKTKCVIECGLGSLTRSFQEHLRNYAKTHPVVYLLRDIYHIQRLLKLDDNSVRLFETSDPSHRNCSNFEFFNLEDQSSCSVEDDPSDRRSANYSFKLKHTKEDFTRFVRFITGAGSDYTGYDSPYVLPGTPTENRLYTHAIFIRLSHLLRGEVDLTELDSGGDAIELCVDRWRVDMVDMISRQVALIRRKTGLPVIVSSDMISMERRSGISGKKLDEAYFIVLNQALRLGVDYVVVDLANTSSYAKRIIGHKGRTKVIGHRLVEPPYTTQWDHAENLKLFAAAEELGCDIVRLLRVAESRDDNETLFKFVDQVKALPGTHAPLIAYNVGILGRTSQLFNPTLTPVTHPAIKHHGEMDLDPRITAKDAVQGLFHSFLLDPLNFYILGASVAYSLSPAMHNAAFRTCGMSHTYQIPETASLDMLDRFAKDRNFGGASIVQPWRVEVFRKLSSKSLHAEAIGAVNTIMPLHKNASGLLYPLPEQAKYRNRAGLAEAWYGENTDWVSMVVCFSRNLSPRNAISPLKSTGLVIGAGGMARAAIYAMMRLGCRKIFIFNRTIENAEKVAQHFNSWASSPSEAIEVVRVLRSLKDEWPSDSKPPCMIVSCVPANSIGNEPPANFEMPLQWLKSPSGGVVLELAYKPLETPLLRQMRRIRAETGTPWVLVDGLEIVAEQGIAQFELLTGRKAPRRLMRSEVLRNYVGENGPFDEKTIQARLDGII